VRGNFLPSSFVLRPNLPFTPDNSAKAESDSSQKQSPGLYIAIHDPALTFQQALEQNFTRMTLIAASGQTAINLGLRYRQATDYSEAYDYEMTISSVPAQSVACEWDGSDVHPTTACFATLRLQYPTFDKRTIKRTHSMQWPVSACMRANVVVYSKKSSADAFDIGCRYGSWWLHVVCTAVCLDNIWSRICYGLNLDPWCFIGLSFVLRPG